MIGEDTLHQETAANNFTNNNVSDDVLAGEAVTLTELRHEASVTVSCHAKTFLETVYGDFCAVRSTGQELDDDDDDERYRGITSVTRRIVCVEKTNYHTSGNAATVQLFNSSQLLSHLGSRANSSIFGRCTVVLFYAPWCTFCVRLAAQYNALARAFPTLDVVAIDAYHFSR